MKAKRFASVDRDLAGALPALRRAAAAARRLSIEISTPFYVFETPNPRNRGRWKERRIPR